MNSTFFFLLSNYDLQLKNCYVKFYVFFFFYSQFLFYINSPNLHSNSNFNFGSCCYLNSNSFQEHLLLPQLKFWNSNYSQFNSKWHGQLNSLNCLKNSTEIVHMLYARCSKAIKSSAIKYFLMCYMWTCAYVVLG